MSYRDYGYDKKDPQAVLLDPPAIRRRARRVRHEFWRDTYAQAWKRRLIGSCLACVLAAIVIYTLIVLAFQAGPR